MLHLRDLEIGPLEEKSGPENPLHPAEPQTMELRVLPVLPGQTAQKNRTGGDDPRHGHRQVSGRRMDPCGNRGGEQPWGSAEGAVETYRGAEAAD